MAKNRARGKTAPSVVATLNRNRLWPKGKTMKPFLQTDQLERLSPLSMIHYTSPIPAASLVTANRAVLKQLGRIMGTLTLFMDTPATAEQIEFVLEILQEIKTENPSLDPGISFYGKPWTRTFPSGQPPTYTVEDQNEIDWFTNKLTERKGWVDAWNTAESASIPVNGLLLESERFSLSDPTDAAWDAAITTKMDAIYDVMKSLYPTVRVEWYALYNSGLFELSMKHDVGSIACYQGTYKGRPYPRFEQGVTTMLANGDTKLTPWLSLGFAYRQTTPGGPVTTDVRDGYYTPNYPPEWSEELGAVVLNSNHTPGIDDTNWKAYPDRVVFWPHPFDAAASRWMDHFIAYCHGAEKTRA